MSKASIIRDFNTLATIFKHAKKNSSGDLVPGKDPRRQTAYQNAASALWVVPGEEIKSIKVLKKGQKRPDGSGKATKREVYITTNEANNVLVPSGLGKTTSDKIEEYIKTGTIKAANTARAWLKKDKKTEKKLSEDSVTLPSIIMTPLPTMSSFVNNIGTMCCGKYLAVKAAVAIREGEVVSFTGDNFEVRQCGTSDYLSTSMGVLGVSLNSAGVGETVYVCISGFCTVYGSEVFGPNTGGSLIAMSSNPNIDGIAQYVNGLARTQNQLVGILIKAEAAPSGGGPTPPTGAVAKYLIWLNQGLMNTS